MRNSVLYYRNCNMANNRHNAVTNLVFQLGHFFIIPNLTVA